ncbi:MAG: L7Ae/L30e/S12e/Gadd45 family ribosomal protein [Anaerovoracaceae bacterium]|jgi:ribosomal protein L7Ae-like RNA K-turn-binding protein
MRRKIDSYLGFARKSRNLITGYNACISSIKKIKLLIIAEDISENTIKKLRKLAKDHGVTLRIYGKKDDLSKSTGSIERGVYGITDENFAIAILKEIDME